MKETFATTCSMALVPWTNLAGIYKWKDGRLYNGAWSHSRMNGHGIYQWPDGRRYEGGFVDDLREGFGVMIWYSSMLTCRPDGKRYEGEWAKGKRDGAGTLVLSDGEQQQGRWTNDVFVGSSANPPQ